MPRRTITRCAARPERFADHYTQATLFFNSQTPVEQQHIINAFRFELSKVQVPAIRERMVSGLMNVSDELAEAVAEGLGITEMPAPMPKVLQKTVRPEVSESKPLSLFARPGDVGIQTRRIAMLVADGVDGEQAQSIAERIRSEGAVPVFVAPKLGAVAVSGGKPLQADASLEVAPSVVFDAVVICDGEDQRRGARGERPGARVREGSVSPLQGGVRVRRGVDRVLEDGRHPASSCRREIRTAA